MRRHAVAFRVTLEIWPLKISCDPRAPPRAPHVEREKTRGSDKYHDTLDNWHSTPHKHAHTYLDNIESSPNPRHWTKQAMKATKETIEATKVIDANFPTPSCRPHRKKQRCTWARSCLRPQLSTSRALAHRWRATTHAYTHTHTQIHTCIRVYIVYSFDQSNMIISYMGARCTSLPRAPMHAALT